MARARNLDVEPVFGPEAHTLGDESEQAAALRHPGQGEFNRLLVLGEDQAGASDAPCGAERGRSRTAKKPATPTLNKPVAPHCRLRPRQIRA